MRALRVARPFDAAAHEALVVRHADESGAAAGSTADR
jgi:hypothetical protein